MYKLKYLVFITTCFAGVYSASFVNKCKSGDSKCVKESAAILIPRFGDGIPELGIEPVDPLFIKMSDASSPNLKLILTDYTLSGLKSCIPKKVKYDKSKSKIFLKILCSAQLEGSYEIKGQLLILPLEGRGPIHVTINKAEISVEADLNEIEKDGVKYWNIKDYKQGYELKDKSVVVFDNLFGGNDVLASAAKEVIAQSGNEIILEVGSPIIADFVKGVVSVVNKMFHSIPISELIYD
ncbi:uncharacterized protein LOC126975259 [Leptidea sinapis]|uniref:uncharacterized protein LOC126975259 n=1 Tax=Leptidea sinapis TaxID=189913 RepID=UPI00213629E9|nr:uncharacterized protein LOC126975259 [Leptidea sinapis]